MTTEVASAPEKTISTIKSTNSAHFLGFCCGYIAFILWRRAVLKDKRCIILGSKENKKL